MSEKHSPEGSEQDGDILTDNDKHTEVGRGEGAHKAGDRGSWHARQKQRLEDEVSLMGK